MRQNVHLRVGETIPRQRVPLRSLGNEAPVERGAVVVGADIPDFHPIAASQKTTTRGKQRVVWMQKASHVPDETFEKDLRKKHSKKDWIAGGEGRDRVKPKSPISDAPPDRLLTTRRKR